MRKASMRRVRWQAAIHRPKTRRRRLQSTAITIQARSPGWRSGFLMTALSFMQDGLRSLRGPVGFGVQSTELQLDFRALLGLLSTD